MPVDPSPHIPLIYRVCNQMGIHGTDAEEAFSLGLVAIVEAAIKYDPTRNVPVANWLARNIRWSLQSWRRDQRTRENYEAPAEVSAAVIHNFAESSQGTSGTPNVTKLIGNTAKLSADNVSTFAGRQDLCEAINSLPPVERQVIIASIQGYSGLDISKALRITPVAVSRARTKAHAKLREALS